MVRFTLMDWVWISPGYFGRGCLCCTLGLVGIIVIGFHTFFHIMRQVMLTIVIIVVLALPSQHTSAGGAVQKGTGESSNSLDSQ